MILAILVFVMFVGGTAALAKKTGGGGLGRSSRGRLGGSRSRSSGRSRGGASKSSRSSKGRTGGRSKSGGLGGRSSSGSSTWGSKSSGSASWGSKAWKSAGLPNRAKFSDASAAATGKTARAAGRGAKWTTKKVGKGSRWAAATTLIPFDKWLERKRAGLENAAAFSNATPIAPDNSKPEPATTPPPVFVNPKNPTKGETPVEANLDRSAVPPTLAPHLNHVHDFEPENDADLLNMLSAEVHGMHAYAEATSAMFDHCVTGKGLDPSAMQGVSEYADAFTEAAETIARAHQQFLAVYEAIIEAANNGTQMPYDGRFFSGEAAA